MRKERERGEEGWAENRPYRGSVDYRHAKGCAPSRVPWKEEGARRFEMAMCVDRVSSGRVSSRMPVLWSLFVGGDDDYEWGATSGSSEALF